MRLFTAFPLSVEVREYVVGVIDELAESIEGVRWTPSENLHVTLCFIGDCSWEKALEMIPWMEKAARRLPLTLTVGGVSNFLSRGSARVIWVGVHDTIGAIEEVYNVLEKGVKKCGLPREKRKYRPHITIGRAKGRFAPITSELANRIEKNDILLKAEQIVLYKSELGGMNAVHTEIARVGSRVIGV